MSSYEESDLQPITRDAKTLTMYVSDHGLTAKKIMSVVNVPSCSG